MTLARIVRPQGRRGEVLADLFTDFPDLFRSVKGLQLKPPTGERLDVAVEDLWLPTGRSAGRIVLKLAGCESISEAELFTGFEVQMPAEQRLGLDDSTYYVSDLVGCEITSDDTVLGQVEDIHFPVDSQGHRLADSAPLFVVTHPTGELLIPFANAYVQSIDVAAKQIRMSLPTGLVDLNG
ncbi:MAG: ribosome maturation factor RimM [Janthinobacterium lividum]